MQNSVSNAAALLAVVLLLSACAGGLQPLPQKPSSSSEKDGAPPLQLDPGLIPNAVIRHDPIVAAGNKSPYEVFGKTYNVWPQLAPYKATGIASWYGSKFHGRKTSNGEVYNLYALTAAHRNLPIPSYLRVRNIDNGREIIVRVNDRGPFHSARLIDLSYAAAVKLGFAEQGTARVEIATILPERPLEQSYSLAENRPAPLTRAAGPEPLLLEQSEALELRPDAAGASAEASPRGIAYFVQVAALSKGDAAEALAAELAAAMPYNVSVQAANDTTPLYRVRLGGFGSRAEAEAAMGDYKTQYEQAAARIVAVIKNKP